MVKDKREKQEELEVKAYIGFKLDCLIKEKLQLQAKSEERTVSNLIVKIIKEYLKEQK